MSISCQDAMGYCLGRRRKKQRERGMKFGFDSIDSFVLLFNVGVPVLMYFFLESLDSMMGNIESISGSETIVQCTAYGVSPFSFCRFSTPSFFIALPSNPG